MGDKGDNPIIGYRFKTGLHLVGCIGPIDEIQKIEFEEKAAWEGTAGQETIEVDAPDLFGGDDSEGGVSGQVHVLMGGPGQVAPDYLYRHIDSEELPGFLGVHSLVFESFYIGKNPNLKPIKWRGRRTNVTGPDGGTQWYSAKANINGSLNAVHVLREVLTDTYNGMGHPANDLHDQSFQACADTCYTEGMGLSFLWTESIEIEAFVNLILRHMNASLYVDRTDGKFHLQLIRDDYDVNSIDVLDDSDIIDVANLSSPAIGELVNSVTVNYWNTETGKDASVEAQDLALSQQQGAVVHRELDYPMVDNATLATSMATRDLLTLSKPLKNMALICNRLRAAALNVGDPIKITYTPLGITQLVVRVVKLDFGTILDNKIRVDVIQDAFSTPDAIFSTPPPSGWVSPISEPNSCPHRMVVSAPYWDIAKREGDSFAQGLDSTDTYLEACAERPSGDAINAGFWTSLSALTGYTRRKTVNFAPTGVLLHDFLIGEGTLETTFEVSGTDTSGIYGGKYLQIGIDPTTFEICQVVARVGNFITVQRGCLDTVPQNHSAGTRYWFSERYLQSDDILRIHNVWAYAKFTPTTGKGTLPLASAPYDGLYAQNRHYLPYPPGRVTLNGSYFPSKVANSDLTIGWAHRDRIQQTASMLNFTDTGVGPEAGTTYTLQIWNEAGTSMVRSVTGLTGTSYVYTVADEITDFGSQVQRFQIRLWSVRDSVNSMQTYYIRVYRPIPGDSGYGTNYGKHYGA